VSPGQVAGEDSPQWPRPGSSGQHAAGRYFNVSQAGGKAGRAGKTATAAQQPAWVVHYESLVEAWPASEDAWLSYALEHLGTGSAPGTLPAEAYDQAIKVWRHIVSHVKAYCHVAWSVVLHYKHVCLPACPSICPFVCPSFWETGGAGQVLARALQRNQGSAKLWLLYLDLMTKRGGVPACRNSAIVSGPPLMPALGWQRPKAAWQDIVAFWWQASPHVINLLLQQSNYRKFVVGCVGNAANLAEAAAAALRRQPRCYRLWLLAAALPAQLSQQALVLQQAMLALTMPLEEGGPLSLLGRAGNASEFIYWGGGGRCKNERTDYASSSACALQARRRRRLLWRPRGWLVRLTLRCACCKHGALGGAATARVPG
jgi:hypothetical protein